MSALLVACAGSTLPDLPYVGVEQNELNKEMEIVFLQSNSYRINQSIDLVIRLHSNIEVYINSNFGARMFMLNEELNQWEEVYDPVTSYSPELDIDLNEVFGVPDELVISTQYPAIFHPKIPIDTKPVKLLIILSGQIYENGVITDRKIGAYSIVSLRP